jgi:predicted DNA-binding protein with PD1-like motif
MKAKLVDGGNEKTFVLIFDPGDEAMAGLLAFAKEEGVASAHFTAIGGFNHVTLGYFDRSRMDYDRHPLDGQVEVLSLIGDIALQGDTPKVHAHAVVGLPDTTTRGGHLLEGHVWPTLEVVLQESPGHLTRRSSPELGIALIKL